jgi:NLI interacting factor-like phosphatase
MVETKKKSVVLPHKQAKKYANKEIILFDLNGTLVHRVEKNRVIILRPFIQDLKKLKGKYALGVYTSCTYHNTMYIIDTIEDICGTIFDRDLIFTREHTVPFTEEEREKYGLPEYKMKKNLSRLFVPEVLKRVKIIDNESFRVDEQDAVIPLSGWYNDNAQDNELSMLVSRLTLSTTELPPQGPDTPVRVDQGAPHAAAVAAA